MYYIRAGYYTRAKSEGNIEWYYWFDGIEPVSSVSPNLRERPNKQSNKTKTTQLKKVKIQTKSKTKTKPTYTNKHVIYTCKNENQDVK